MPDILVLSPEKKMEMEEMEKRKSLRGNKSTRLKYLGRCKNMVNEK